jgi:hypothetical protein
MRTLYLRLLGARIGKNVTISSDAKLGEFDLLVFEDGCRVDSSLIRGFCVEPEGYFRLETIVIGRNATINTFTQIAPGSHVPPSTVYGPHSSSFETASPDSHAAYNKTLNEEPHWILKLFVAYPVILFVYIISCECPALGIGLCF